jgi:hypothetical protein
MSRVPGLHPLRNALLLALGAPIAGIAIALASIIGLIAIALFCRCHG